MTANVATAAVDPDDAMFNERIGIGKNFIVAIQHVLVMTAGTIAVPLILGPAIGLDAATTSLLVSASFLACGFTILLHALRIGGVVGNGLPVIFGTSFTPLGSMIAIGNTYGTAALFGAVIGSGVLILISTLFLEKVLRLFPRVVVGVFVTLIGITLAPAAVHNLAGGTGADNYGSTRNLALGFGVLAIIVLVERFGKGTFRILAMLIGLLGGTLIAVPLGMVNFDATVQAPWFRVVEPLHFGMPRFHVVPILLMTLFCFINVLQCIGGYWVLDEVAGSSTSNAKAVRGVRAQAAGQVLGGFFSATPSTVYQENMALIRLNGVKSRWAFATAALMIMLLGVSAKLAAAITAVPKPVIGGATLYLFGVITAAGLSILGSLDFSKFNYFTIVGTSVAVGVGVQFTKDAFTQLPNTLSLLLGDGLFMVAITAVVLNLLFNGFKAVDDTEASPDVQTAQAPGASNDTDVDGRGDPPPPVNG